MDPVGILVSPQTFPDGIRMDNNKEKNKKLLPRETRTNANCFARGREVDLKAQYDKARALYYYRQIICKST